MRVSGESEWRAGGYLHGSDTWFIVNRQTVNFENLIKQKIYMKQHNQSVLCFLLTHKITEN